VTRPQSAHDVENLEEEHELSFRGLWMPEVIIRSFLAEKINASEAMLLAIIDGFSKSGKCWASNNYLAKRMNLDERHLRRMLTSLCQLNLLEKIQTTGGQRFLRTICGINKLGDTSEETCTDTPRTLRPTCTDTPRTLAPGGEGICAPQDIKTRGKEKISVASFDGEQKLTREEKLAVLLKEGLSASKKLTRKVVIKNWAAEFRKLLSENPELNPKEIGGLISWYTKNINAEFMPQAFSAATFVEKFPAILAAKSRAEKNDAPTELTVFAVTPKITAAAEQIRMTRRNIDSRVSESLGVLLAGLEKFFQHVKQTAQDYSKEHEHKSRAASGKVLERRIYTGLGAATAFAESLLADRRTRASDFDPRGEKMRAYIEAWQRDDGAPASHTAELWRTICETWLR
jgi:hypothetical protein